MTRRVELPYAPRPQFAALHQRKQRWAVIVAHRRAGKTVACVGDLVLAALATRKQHAQYAYVAPYYGQAKQVAWSYLRRMTADLASKINETELRVELLNGSSIRLFGADNPDSLRGLYLDGVILDEYADMRPRVWGEIIRPMLSDRRGWAVWIGTPKGHNSFYDIVQQAQRSPDWYCQIMRASESEILPADEIADAQRTMSADQFRQEYECDFEAAITGAVYGPEMRQAQSDGRIAEFAPWPNVPVHTAWDLGYSDATAIWFFQAAQGEVRIVDYYESNGQTIAHYAAVLRDRGYKYGTHWLPHDAVPATFASGGRSALEQLGEYLGRGSLRVVPRLDLQDGIQATRLAFPRLCFDVDKCRDGIEALRQYQYEWDEDKKTFKLKPRHDWTSHPADALRYLAIAYREERPEPAKPEPKWLHNASLDELWALQPKKGKRI